MNRKLTIVLLLLTIVALMGVPGALAISTYKDDFNAKYNTTGTRIDQCILCHVNPGGGFPLNPYGTDLDNQLKNLTSTPSNANQSTVNQGLTNIEPLDSDGDGFINIDEIHNLTFPGNASDFPPKITSFAPPSPVTSAGTPATVTFNVTINQVVDNATWTLDGTVNKTEHNVNASNVTLTTSVIGTHTVTFAAQKTGDGSAMQNWTWNVTNVTVPPTLKSITVSPSTTMLNVSETKVFTATALDQNNTPMPGVNINWTSSNMTVGAVSPSSATTNMNGTATTTFTALAAGTAMVNATNGTVSGSATVNVITNVTAVQTFNISGFKINGTNNNGMGIENWNIMLLNPDTGAEIANTTTDSMGFYKFSNLTNGIYNVTEGMMTGWMNISAMSQIITINGTDVMNVNFTNALVPPQETFNISGFKIDASSGSGIPGWNITITNTTMQKSMLTGADGSYKFTGLVSGTYNVSEEMKSGFTPVGATFKVITIENMNVMNVNFTNTPVAVKNGSISGFKINAANGMGLQNWTIRLIGIVGKGTGTRVIRMDTTTNADGFYMFNNLPAGRYIIREELQRGSVPVGSPVKHIMLTLGENSMNNNFTNRPIRSLVGIEDRDKEDHKDTENHKDTEDDRDTNK